MIVDESGNPYKTNNNNFWYNCQKPKGYVSTRLILYFVKKNCFLK